MRKTIPALLSLLLAVSCGREEVLPARVDVVFEASVPSVRSAVTSHEDDIVRLDLLAFRADDGTLDASGHSEGSTRVSASLTGGTAIRWWIVANAPDGALDGFPDEASFLAGTTLLGHTTDRSMVMRSSGSVTPGPSTGTVRAYLDRYACKVSVGTVSVSFGDAWPDPGEVTLGRIVLVNARGDVPWSGSPSPDGTWYNRAGLDASLPSGVADLLVWEGGHAAVGSSPVTVGASLYAMPNPVSNGVHSGNTSSWSPRSTRVALELLLSGTSHWYPVDLPAMECNRHYVLDMTVRGPGSGSPDIPVDREAVLFSTSVKPWGTQYTISEDT